MGDPVIAWVIERQDLDRSAVPLVLASQLQDDLDGAAESGISGNDGMQDF
jgi:hypothetical protein